MQRRGLGGKELLSRRATKYIRGARVCARDCTAGLYPRPQGPYLRYCSPCGARATCTIRELHFWSRLRRYPPPSTLCLLLLRPLKTAQGTGGPPFPDQGSGRTAGAFLCYLGGTRRAQKASVESSVVYCQPRSQPSLLKEGVQRRTRLSDRQPRWGGCWAGSDPSTSPGLLFRSLLKITVICIY